MLLNSMYNLKTNENMETNELIVDLNSLTILPHPQHPFTHQYSSFLVNSSHSPHTGHPFPFIIDNNITLQLH